MMENMDDLTAALEDHSAVADSSCRAQRRLKKKLPHLSEEDIIVMTLSHLANQLADEIGFHKTVNTYLAIARTISTLYKRHSWMGNGRVT
jgi:hypothetical protein